MTERNDRAGIIGSHFYCEGHGPYEGPGDAGDESQRMTDHSGRLARLHY